LLKERKIFLRKRKYCKIKASSILLYHAGLSYGKTSKILSDFGDFSHEAARQWYLKCEDLFIGEKTKRRAVAVDETKVKIETK